MIYWCRDGSFGCGDVYRISTLTGDTISLERWEIPEAEPEHRLCRTCASLLRSARNGGIDAESLCYGEGE